MADQMDDMTGSEIAVIGMAGKFPGAKNIDEFWENLKNGIESLWFISPEELKNLDVDPNWLMNPNYVNANGGVLEDKGLFDAVFFGYTPKEAEIMDPQIRIFYECVWGALEEAGYDPGKYNGFIGLYAGAGASVYWENLTNFSGKYEDLGYFASGLLNNKDLISTQIAYKLNLKGPCYTVQTACSTSLVVIHLACQGILNGECNMALAGGVRITHQKRVGYIYQEGMINSADGHCRAFDAKAKGTLGGEGSGVVLLKSLEDAITDRDHIYAIIKGTATNNDGLRKVGYTAPSIEGQAEVIHMAQQVAEAEPDSIGYVEAHGTGTELGDVVEIEALKLAFNTNKKNFCAIGSVKTNIGHLDAAAGVTGFIKTVLALKYRLIPPSLHFEAPNPRIDFKNSPFFLNNRLMEWKSNGYPRRAGVSSFGIGGTNAHIVLEEWTINDAQMREKEEQVNREYQLILLSAKTPSALDWITENLGRYLKANREISLPDAAYTLTVGRKNLEYRRMLVCKDVDSAIASLSTSKSRAVHSFFAKEQEKSIIFIFSGLGSQYVNMGQELYQKEPVFREEMDHCFEILKSLLDYNIKEILYPGEESAELHEKIKDFEVAQIVIFIFEYALARLAIKWGLKPDAMIGYSFGEYAAAGISGIFSLESALKLIVSRGKLIQKMPPGAMLSVPLPIEELLPFINSELSIAIDNGTSCIVAGSEPVVTSFEKQMNQRKILCIRVPSSYAIHSPMMNPILKEFEQVIVQFTLNKPEIPFISNVTGTWIAEDEIVKPAYWAKHLRDTVRFSRGMKKLVMKDKAVFIEIGPAHDLSALAGRYLKKDRDQIIINLVRHPHQNVSDVFYLLNKIGRMWLYGVKIDWNRFYPGEERYRIPLPTYPFEGQRYWLDWDMFAGKTEITKKKPQSRVATDMSDWFYLPSWKRFTLYPVSQKIDKKSVNYNWLVFVNDLNPGKLIVNRLENEGHTVVLVKTGNVFERKDQRTYIVNPGESNNYDDLFNELRRLKVFPDRIIQCWGLTGEDHDCPGMKSFEEDQYLGFYSLLYIIQAIGKKIFSNSIEITVLTDHLHEVAGGEPLNPAKSTVLGLISSIPQEYTGIQCGNIDIVLPKPGTPGEEALIDTLMEELTDGHHEPVVAIRNNKRWVRMFEPLHLGPGLKDYAKLRKDGIYLITGGLGDIGLMLSEMLARRVKARLVLTGRSQFPPKDKYKIKKLQQVEALGGQVLYIQADASNLKQMREVVLRTEQTFGMINGVIHCAGVTEKKSMAMIQFLSSEICSLQFQSKAYGAAVLEELFKNKELDFTWMLSSIASFLGGLGFAHYAAASIFMDTLVRRHNRLEKKHRHWLSLNWNGMEAEESIEIFERLLSLEKVDQIIFSVGGNLQERVERSTKQEELEKQVRISVEGENKPKGHPRPYLIEKYVPPKNFEEREITAIWERILGIDGIGANDNFLELGGDSLKAIIMLTAVQKKMNVKVPLAEVFKTPTISELSQYIKESAQEEFAALELAEEKEYYLLSSAQKRLYFLQQMSLNSIAYNMPEIIHLTVQFDWGKIEETFKKLIKRHESLRTSFHLVKDTPVQVIHEGVEFNLDLHDLNGPHSSRDFIKRFIKPFDLTTAPLIRVGLIKEENNSPILIVDMHHIISDMISHQVLVKDFQALYNEKETHLLWLQYKDFSEWQNKEIEKGELKHQEEYWLNEFAGEIPVLELPYDYPRPLVQSFEGNSVNFEISELETRALSAMALKGGSTLFMVLAAVVNILLSKLSGQEEIIMGTPIVGRRHADLEKIIGIFVNTLPLKNYPAGNRTFGEFLGDVKEKMLLASENQEYPFEELVDKLVLNRDIGRNPLFDVMFVLQNMKTGYTGQEKEIELETGPGVQPDSSKEYEIAWTSKFDLNVFSEERESGLFLSFQYCTKLFKKRTVERFINYFRKIISIIGKEAEIRISEIDVLSEEERRIILYEFNNNRADFPRDKTIYQLIEKHAEITPDRVAIIGTRHISLAVGKEERREQGVGTKSQFMASITYRELNQRANRLAQRLTDIGIRANELVGILMERSLAMVESILAVWKAGGAYIPLDPHYPQERINAILYDSNTRVLFTQANTLTGPGLISFYSGIGSHTKVRYIISLDEVSDIKYHSRLFRTSRYAALVNQGLSRFPDRELILDNGQQTLTYQEIISKINNIHQLVLERGIDLESGTAIMFSNPIYNILVGLYLNTCGLPFIALEPRSNGNQKKQVIDESRITTIFSECLFLDELDQLLWESTTFRNLMLIDDYDIRTAAKESYFKEIWDYVAQETSEDINDYGWTSSYTNEPFTLEEMKEYILNFKVKLNPHLAPGSRILDIGCGHGLVLYEIAPRVSYYLATDLSPVIIERNKLRVIRDKLHQVELKVAAASEIDRLKEKEFDLVVCSSVVHYFPNTLYLEKVIESAINVLKEEGVIYLDDLMDLEKKKELVRSTIEHSQLNPGIKVKTDWTNDLFVDIDFFHDLQQKHPEIIEWQCTRKLGRLKNELTRFRYDVLLKINKQKSAPVQQQPFSLNKQRCTLKDIETPPLDISYWDAVTSNTRSQSVISLEEIGEAEDLRAAASYSQENLEPVKEMSDLSYVIYTSGSTGKPKGAMIEHIGMMNHIHAKINDLELTESSIVAQNASHTFDISVWQFFSALIPGGQTVIYPEKLILEPDKFTIQIIKNQITILEVVPSYLSAWLDSIGDGQKMPLLLRYLLVTGEEIKPHLVGKWFDKYPEIKMVNAYGPTEASDDITHYIINKASDKVRIPIGKPIQNMKIYIVDNNMNLCPIGVKGEICVAGVGVGKGYLGDEDRTRQAFMENPFVGEKGCRLYKTGDLGRWRPDGNIEFYGRKDYQVKIRGFRIELGEIENQVLKHPEIKEAVVIDRTDEVGNKYLCAYISAQGTLHDSFHNELREFLSRTLPDYMVPAHFVQLEKIPLTTNGKVDRKALPEPEIKAKEAHIAPRNDVEEKLAGIWAEILGIEKDIISMDSNFFALGGHSLKATIMVSKIHKELNRVIALEEIFKVPTIQGIASLIGIIQWSENKEYGDISDVRQREEIEL